MKKELSQSEVWEIAGNALHDEEYRTNYSQALASVLKDKNLKILDTAGGTGFPTFDLYKLGFTNISVTDGNETYAKELEDKFEKEGMGIKAIHSSWQELGEKISKKFDVVINADNSFVYMDGWMNGEMAEGLENIMPRIQLCLKSFLGAVKDGGSVIIGLGKHYDGVYPGSDRTFDSEKNGEKMHTTWKSTFDWNKRVNTWTTRVESELSEGRVVRKSYLITKEELAEQMKIAGFKEVHIIIPDNTRDDLIIGIK